MNQFMTLWYSLTIFISAFLLFSVQPMVTKTLLPILGGGSHVWIVSVVFFQVILMLGYGYAHLLHIVLPAQPTRHIIVHGVFILLGLISLPILPLSVLTDVDYQHPMVWQFMSLSAMIGLPFFVLSVTAPLFQKWYGYLNTPHSQDPYFLYGASNAGSLIALLSYPFIIETALTLEYQHTAWFYGYIALTIIALITFITFIKTNPTVARPATPHKGHLFQCSGRQWRQWVFWAAIPSSLMLGLTSIVTQDIMSVPLFWVIPLALYLLSYIVTFRKKTQKWLDHIDPVFITLAIASVMMSIQGGRLSAWHLLLFVVTFMIIAIAFHHKIYMTRPDTERLTEFYLAIAVGGALGGLFNSLAAPLLFDRVIEFELVLALSLFASLFLEGFQLERLYRHQFFPLLPLSVLALSALTAILYSLGHLNPESILIALGILAIALFVWTLEFWSLSAPLILALFLIPYGLKGQLGDYEIIHTERNYYGASVVMRHQDDHIPIYRLVHGTTLHGQQYRGHPYSQTPLAYYGQGSGLQDIIDYLNDQKKPQRIAAVGLGVGTMACHGERRRHIDFYEIDPAVIDIAKNADLFTYLEQCPYSSIIEDDGRLGLSNARTASYDGLILDAFSSDSIPAHLLTLEAINTYQEKLKTGGFILFHLSNRHLSLAPSVARTLKEAGWMSYRKVSKTKKRKTLSLESAGEDQKKDIDISDLVFGAEYVVALSPEKAKDMNFYLRFRGWLPMQVEATAPLWTDSYTPLFHALKW